ncbi:sodium:solute symporter family transporter [Pseudosulfitobacter koreensis]|uniref:Sodium:proline symporter n=1 Tax=Pseudosulfitobacter koreensis TaxID=2968472 RepID=A0ABT1Z023_9RHOB|nr:sodium:proline symporter [Pseudosulfitobacter koreense]MCR8826488.1 sodium:proline symporter [Pseudosulfitobacter koreense]
MQPVVLIAIFAGIVVASLLAAPRRVTIDGFFGGRSAAGGAPGLWVLVLSQVTTWIFARSLMNAAILGYYYGIAGTLAYAAYYASFLTGGFFVQRLRETGAMSVQDWLATRFGPVGTGCYNLVIVLRLLSEVFANLLVVGLIAGALVQGGATPAILAVAVLGFAYSAWGGLSAALRTDVVQMLVFLVVFGVAFVALVTGPGFDLGAVLTAQGTAGALNGWVLLVVAALQVVSYPLHDPVMMDRGFISDMRTTRASFLHAFWISTLCILGFGFFGIQAGLIGATYEGELIGTWGLMFPPWIFVLLMTALVVSALSTLDSALASASRLVVEELHLAPRTLSGGRGVMALFMLAGALLTLWGNATLFDAVAVSGTASMFLAPVMIVGLVMGRQVALWSYVVAFGAAMLGAWVYFARGWTLWAMLLPDAHKYVQLLAICVVVLGVGFAAVLAGARRA